jgi:polyisoprenoid-binding protein YceI
MLIGPTARANAPVTVDAARVTIAGTSNLHDFSASTTNVRVTRAELNSAANVAQWSDALKPGVVQAFEVAIPSETLTSAEKGLDKNMYKALKTGDHADIVFRLAKIEPADTAGIVRATGTLSIAGVEREVSLDLTAKAEGSSLDVKGSLDLLMTDYGITPPKAMLGMLRTNPKVTVSFAVVLRSGPAAAIVH